MAESEEQEDTGLQGTQVGGLSVACRQKECVCCGGGSVCEWPKLCDADALQHTLQDWLRDSKHQQSLFC